MDHKANCISYANWTSVIVKTAFRKLTNLTRRIKNVIAGGQPSVTTSSRIFIFYESANQQQWENEPRNFHLKSLSLLCSHGLKQAKTLYLKRIEILITGPRKSNIVRTWKEEHGLDYLFQLCFISWFVSYWELLAGNILIGMIQLQNELIYEVRHLLTKGSSQCRIDYR